MPYKLRKQRGKDLYWVVNKDTGKKYSNEPLPKERAQAQMRALYSHMEGGDLSEAIEYGKKTFTLREYLPPYVRKILNQYGKLPITKIEARRDPLSKKILAGLNILTLGKLNTLIGQTDKFFHTSLEVTVAGKVWMIEKNEIIEIIPVKPRNPDTETMNVPLNRFVSMNQLMNSASKIQGANFLYYDPVSNNCQKFCTDCLKGNRLLNPAINAFLNQDLNSLLSKIPWYSKAVARFVTDSAARVNRAIYGEGKLRT